VSGIPVACGGLQPDPPGQPAQPSGGTGMKLAERSVRGRFSPRREGRKPVHTLQSTDQEAPMTLTAAARSRNDPGLLLWAAISVAS
jgi:hypothetical protein